MSSYSSNTTNITNTTTNNNNNNNTNTHHNNNDKFIGPNLNVTLTCPDCKTFPPELIERFSEGDIICGQCGLVLSDRIVDTRSEWRTFQNDDKNSDDPSRVGDASNSLYDTEDLTTMISYNVNSGGSNSGSKNNNLNKIQQKSLVDKKNYALQAAYQRITELCNGYQLPKSVSDAAKHLYKAVREDRLLKGKSQDAIMASTILLGCRRAEVPRTLEEIRALTNVPTKQIAKITRLIKKIIHSHLNSNDTASSIVDETTNLVTHSAEDLIRRFCSHLGMDLTITNGSEYIARKCNDLGILAGRSPTTIAATSIYLAAKILGDTKLTQQQIRDKTGVSIGTIKNSYKILYEKAKDLIDPSWEENGKVKWENIPKS